MYSSATILKCSCEVPNGAPCLIKASSYKVKVKRIDICKNNPFPKIRSTPDYAGSYCLNLFDKKNNSKKINLSNNQVFNLPDNLISQVNLNLYQLFFEMNLPFQENIEVVIILG